MNVLRRHGVEVAASALTAVVVVALTVVAPLPRIAAAVPQAHALARETKYSLDSVIIDGRATRLRWHPQPALRALRGDAIVFAGWAVDAAAHAPATEVSAIVDGEQRFDGLLGGARPDVAATFAEPAYGTAGFAVAVAPCSLGPGAHRFAFRFRAADGRDYYRSRDDVDVRVDADAHPVYGVASLTPPPARPGAHTLRGWIADTGTCRSLGAVEVVVDDRVVARANVGLVRVDVARRLGAAAFARSGFVATWNDAGLPPGPHELRLRARTSEARQIATGYRVRFVR